jgi:hypothetical protein
MDDTAASRPRRPRRRRLAGALILAAALAFGGIDQYIGSLFSNFATAVSVMSAPWLLLPFAAGAVQVTRRSAAGVGLAATWLAVIGYVLMIDSPAEGAHPTVQLLAATARSQWPWFLGGLISGPGYGLLGYFWRARRSWLSAVLAAIPVLLEPVANRLGFRPSIDITAGYAEATAGLVLAVYFGYVLARARRAPVA